MAKETEIEKAKKAQAKKEATDEGQKPAK